MPVEEFRGWPGKTAVGPDGDKIGKIENVYLDRQTGEPTFASVKTGMFGGKASLVPVEKASLKDEDVVFAWDKAKVKDAPGVEPDEELSETEEARLYEYYSLTGYSQYEGAEHETVATNRGTVGHDTSGPNTDEAMTRSEEELRVGKTTDAVGKARLHKYIVTENVSTSVPVSHEEARVVREPITEENRDAAYSGGELTEEEHEVTLHAETPVVQKDVVAKERVRLDTETITEDAQVDESVRKEVIESDGDVERRP